MLARKLKFYRDISFFADVASSIVILEAVYLFLYFQSDRLESALQSLTGYPFQLQGMEHLVNNGWLFPVLILCLFLSFYLNRYYALELRAPGWKVVFASCKSVAIGLALCTVFFYGVGVVDVNRSLLFGFFGLFNGYHVCKELLYRHYLVHHRFKKQPLRSVLVCAESELSKILKSWSDESMKTAVVTGICITDNGDAETLPNVGIPIFRMNAFSECLSKQSADFVYLVDHGLKSVSRQTIISQAEEQGVEVWYFANFLEPIVSRPQYDEFGGRPVLVFSSVPHYEGKFLLKRLFDLFGSVALGALFGPLVLAIFLSLWMQGKGSVIYVQERTGRRGKTFRMYKFRTMDSDADAKHSKLTSKNELRGPAFKLRDDPRVTPVGRLLRRYSLDEIPQLWNVIKGDMSLVGPRPLPVYETAQFEGFSERRRLSVLPGLTGLWQVSGRADIEDFSEWVRLDLKYIDEWSLWLDLKIMLRTIPRVLAGNGAR